MRGKLHCSKHELEEKSKPTKSVPILAADQSKKGKLVFLYGRIENSRFWTPCNSYFYCVEIEQIIMGGNQRLNPICSNHLSQYDVRVLKKSTIMLEYIHDFFPSRKLRMALFRIVD
ncbi:hypothetical protein D3C85_1101810 [compost metagenome]